MAVGPPGTDRELNRLKAALQPDDCVKVAALDRLGRSLTEGLELPGWLRETEVDIISLRESIGQDSAMGAGDAAPGHRIHRDGARTWPGREHWRGLSGSRPPASASVDAGGQPEAGRGDIQNMRQRDGLSWGRIATITGLPSSSICRTCTWDLEEIAPTACGGRITGTSGRPGSCVEQVLPD